MGIKKAIGWTFLGIVVLVLSFVAFVLVAMTIEMTINLNGFRDRFNQAVTEGMGRE
jgi:hypothetical protein